MMSSGPFLAGRFSALLPLIWGIFLWLNWLTFNPLSLTRLKTAFKAYGRIDLAAAIPACAGHALWAAGLGLLILAALGAGGPAASFLGQRGRKGVLLCRGALGAGILSMGVLGLGFAGLVFPGLAWLLAACAAFLGFRELAARRPRGNRPAALDPGWRNVGAVWLSAGLILALFVALVGAMAPARAYDALFHHLAHPRIFAEYHKVVGLPHHFLSYYPALLEMQYLLAMLLGGGMGFAKLVHFAWGAFVLVLVFRWARESLPVAWALAAVLGFSLLPYVQLAMMWAYVDLGAAGYLALALWLACGRRERPAILGVICGFCAGAKASGILAVILAGALLVGRRSFRRSWAVFLLAFFLVALPWGIRNWVISGNPFAPFMSGVFPTLNFDPGNMSRYRSELTSYSDKAELPGRVFPLLALPWNASIRNLGVLDNQGGMSAWFLFALPCLFFFPARAARIPALLTGGYFLLWLAIPRQVRYLLPIWPVAAIASVHGLREMARRGGLPALAVAGAGAMLLLHLLIAFQRLHYTADPLRAVFGSESAEKYLERGIGGRPYSVWAASWVRAHLPEERLLVVSDFGLGTLWGPKAVFQSAFDTPLIQKFARESPDPAGIRKKFRQLGAGYILYGAVGGFPMQREYGIFSFDEGSAGRWRSFWRRCTKPVHGQNDRYFVYALGCAHSRPASVLPGLDEQALADIEGLTRRLEKSGGLQQALSELVKEYDEIARKWDSPLAYEQLGWALLEAKRPAAARAALKRAENLGRDSASLHYVQGLVAVGDSDFAGAITRFKRCLELDPTMQEARGRLADLLTQLGRAGEARELMNWRQ